MKKFLVLLSFLLVFTSCFNDSKSAETVSALQSVVDTYYAAADHKQGISVAIYGDGYTWTYAKGTAAAGVAMTTSTPTYAYSITKTFVSALVLSQIEDGLYTLDQTVEQLLNDDTDYSALTAEQKARLNTSATVADLLKHTSGMPDYASNVSALVAMCNPAITWEPVDILKNIVNTAYIPENFTNHVFNYSNTNYVLLGMIAEHKGAKALNVLLDEAFFTPIGMDTVLAPQDSVPTDIAHPYDDAYLFGNGTTPPIGTFMDLTFALYGVNTTFIYYLGVGRGTWAAGGIISRADDLAKWGYELYDASGTAVSATVRGWIKDSAPQTGNYGYGVSRNDFTYSDGTRGIKYGHGGSAPGYKTLLRYETTEGIAIAIITNENNSVGSALNPSANDAALGIIDREGLVDDLLDTYKAGK